MAKESYTNQNKFVDCGGTVKIENIKKEINEEENVKVETIKEEINDEETENCKVFDAIKEEVKDEEGVYDPCSVDYDIERGVKQEIKEEAEESDEEQGVDEDTLVDCSQFIQVQMNLSN